MPNFNRVRKSALEFIRENWPQAEDKANVVYNDLGYLEHPGGEDTSYADLMELCLKHFDPLKIARGGAV